MIQRNLPFCHERSAAAVTSPTFFEQPSRLAALAKTSRASVRMPSGSVRHPCSILHSDAARFALVASTVQMTSPTNASTSEVKSTAGERVARQPTTARTLFGFVREKALCCVSARRRSAAPGSTLVACTVNHASIASRFELHWRSNASSAFCRCSHSQSARMPSAACWSVMLVASTKCAYTAAKASPVRSAAAYESSVAASARRPTSTAERQCVCAGGTRVLWYSGSSLSAREAASTRISRALASATACAS
mmetsp:Transcript_2979/g.6752  ORF Transcript_2979/g.6752 Transcript_2979/m.6752 type:complete len:251 (+) Transcript_2979:385-1137(+)